MGGQTDLTRAEYTSQAILLASSVALEGKDRFFSRAWNQEMLRNLPVVVIQTQYSSDDVEVETMARQQQPKRERRLRHTSPSPTRSRFLRIVRRNEDVTGNGKRTSHGEVKRCHSYHDIEEAAFAVGAEHGRDEHRPSTSGVDLAAMSTAAAVSSNAAASGPVNATHHLTVEQDEPRQRKSSGGSHNILLSLGGLRFGGKKKKDKRGVSDLPSPVPPELCVDGDAEVTLYR